jgi:predicted short-subunit dehydrogenase-like oxidoreductase (DUF2520 family)
MQTVSIIGAGRVGCTLGRLMHQSGAVRIVSVHCRQLAHAQQAVSFIGAGTPVDQLEDVAAADMYLIAVPDDALALVAQALARQGVATRALVFHVSGAGDADLLAPLRSHGARLASLHPVFSFADPARAVEQFSGVWCALEGDGDACVVLDLLVRQLGGQPFQLAAGGKVAYHAALSIASNYLVTLTSLAQSVARQAGLEAELTNSLLASLMHRTLDNVLALGPEAALTGPLARGDLHTVEGHLQVLTGAVPNALYRALGRATLPLTKLEPAKRAAMQALFDAPEGA